MRPVWSAQKSWSYWLHCVKIIEQTVDSINFPWSINHLLIYTSISNNSSVSCRWIAILALLQALKLTHYFSQFAVHLHAILLNFPQFTIFINTKAMISFQKAAVKNVLLTNFSIWDAWYENIKSFVHEHLWQYFDLDNIAVVLWPILPVDPVPNLPSLLLVADKRIFCSILQ